MKSTLTSMPLEMQQALKSRRMHCEWASPPAKSWFNSVIFIHIQGTVVHSCEEEVVPVCARSSDWLSTYWNNQANREPKTAQGHGYTKRNMFALEAGSEWHAIRTVCLECKIVDAVHHLPGNQGCRMGENAFKHLEVVFDLMTFLLGFWFINNKEHFQILWHGSTHIYIYIIYMYHHIIIYLLSCLYLSPKSARRSHSCGVLQSYW